MINLRRESGKWTIAGIGTECKKLQKMFSKRRFKLFIQKKQKKQ